MYPMRAVCCGPILISLYCCSYFFNYLFVSLFSPMYCPIWCQTKRGFITIIHVSSRYSARLVSLSDHAMVLNLYTYPLLPLP